MSKEFNPKDHQTREHVIHAIEASAATYGLYRIAQHWLRHHHDAEDVMQTAYLKALKAVGSFKGDSEITTWLYRIASNAAKDEHERKLRDPVTGLRGADEGVIYDLEDDDETADPVTAYLLGESNDRVRELLAPLIPQHRAAVGLNLLGLSDEEISAMTGGTNVNTIKVNRHRGIAAIRQRLAEELDI